LIIVAVLAPNVAREARRCFWRSKMMRRKPLQTIHFSRLEPQTKSRQKQWSYDYNPYQMTERRAYACYAQRLTIIKELKQPLR
jgi:hypothetical protein